MNPLSAIFRFRSRDKPKNSGNNMTFLFGTPSSSGQVVNEETAMQSVAVYSCIRILAESIAGLPLHVYRSLPSGGRERANEHPLSRILHDEPNPEMSSFVYRETVMGHMLLYGNSYSQIIRNGRGEVVALYPLLPNKMEVGRNAGGQLMYTYYRDVGEGAPGRKAGYCKLSRDEVLHIPALGFDGLVGYSPIAMARNAIGMSLAAEEFGAKFYANSANPSGVIEYAKEIKDPEQFKRDWDAKHSGLNQHKTAILEDGMTFKPIQIHPTDAQFLETRRFQLHEIARLFRIPPSMLGDLERATYNSAEQMSLDFVKFSLNPWLARLEQAFFQSLLLPGEKGTYFIRFNLDGLLRGDHKARFESYALGIQNGIYSVNNILALEELNPLSEEEGGNLHVINGNAIKLADAGIYAKNRGDESNKDNKPSDLFKRL